MLSLSSNYTQLVTSTAAPRKRQILQLIWLFVIVVIAAALVKLAFFSAPSTTASAPTGVLEAPIITVERATVENTFVVSGSVSADSGVAVRATEQGTITEVYAANGAKVAKGDTLFEVREQTGEAEPRLISEGDPEAGIEPEYSDPEPIYSYYTVTAPASGTLSGFTPLPKMSVSIGEEVGQIGPGTFTVVADLTAAMQYRMLDQPASATVTISGGPAPFTCSSLEIGAPVEQDDAAIAPIDPYMYDPYAVEAPTGSSNVTGQVRCAVPEGESVFAGLNAEVEVTAGIAENVLTLPVTAVRGDYATGIVYLPGDFGDESAELTVELGLTDGVMIEITSGLEESQAVLQYVPSEIPVFDEYAMYDEGF